MLIVQRLPNYLQNKWQDKVYEWQEKEDRIPQIERRCMVCQQSSGSSK